jgi:hypothetical protein
MIQKAVQNGIYCVICWVSEEKFDKRGAISAVHGLKAAVSVAAEIDIGLTD